MFRFDQSDGLGKEFLIDDARRVTFRVFGGAYMSPARPALLSWDGREIPLEFFDTQRVDPTSNKPHTLYHLEPFGSSWTVKRKRNIGAYSFHDSRERAEAIRLAVEAVLVNHFKYVEGVWNVDAVRIAEEGREWRVSDFGYQTSADIAGGSR